MPVAMACASVRGSRCAEPGERKSVVEKAGRPGRWVCTSPRMHVHPCEVYIASSRRSSSGERRRSSAEVLKGAPVPIPRHATRHAAFALLRRTAADRLSAGDAQRRRLRRVRASRADAVPPTGPGRLPQPVLIPAMLTGARVGAVRVKASFLVEWNVVRRVVVAEDVTAATAVMATFEEGKLLVAGRRVADERVGVGL